LIRVYGNPNGQGNEFADTDGRRVAPGTLLLGGTRPSSPPPLRKAGYRPLGKTLKTLGKTHP